MPFVIDASVVATWLLPDESTPEIEALLDRTPLDPAVAPDLLWHEVRSIVLTAIRRGRIAEPDMEPALHALSALAVHNGGAGDGPTTLRLAQRHRLSSYDSTYLALALNQQLPLATLDRRLAAAARTEGLQVLGSVATA